MSSTSALSTRSRTGCMTCKIRRKKCDETHPQCQRCLKSGFECSGYAYVENSGQDLRTGKQKTLPAPRMTKSRLAALARLNASDDPSLTQALDAVRLLAGEHVPGMTASSGMEYASEVSPTFPESTTGSILPTNGETLTTLFNQSDFPISSWGPDLPLAAAFDQDIWPASAFYSTLVADPQLKDYDPAPQAPPPSLATTMMKPMTEGQSTLFQALFSLGQLGNPPIPTSASASSNSASSASLSPDVEDDDESESDEETEHVTEKIRGMIPLDKNAEGNALQFVLESYASWITWVAFEPLRTVRIVQNFVFRHFQEGIDSRLTLVLLANVVRNLGRKNGNINLGYGPMLSLLQARIRQRLEAVSRTNMHTLEERRESIKVLDACLETVVVEFFTSTVLEVRELLTAAAPIFRQLCPETPGTTINLPSLLTQPVVSLRNFAHIDVFFNILMGTPTAFRYDVTGFVSGCGACESHLEMQEDLGLQWLHGTPDQFLVLFAKMGEMWQDGCILDEGGLAEIEKEIRDFKPLNTPSPDAFLPIMRLMVQEAWRLAAYIFLYMALAGDSSSSKRVKSVFKQFVRLLSQIKPSRASDLFLKMPSLLVSPAAERETDRNAIRQRVGTWRDWQCSKDRMRVVEDYWARADVEGRPLVWSDIVVSRIRVMGF